MAIIETKTIVTILPFLVAGFGYTAYHESRHTVSEQVDIRIEEKVNRIDRNVERLLDSRQGTISRKEGQGTGSIEKSSPAKSEDVSWPNKDWI